MSDWALASATICNVRLLFRRAARGERFFAPGGRRNLLKRLISDKGIQGNPSQIFCSILLASVRAWLDLAKFGCGLESQSPPARKTSSRPGHRLAIVARAPFGPRAVVETLDLAAGLLDRQRQDRRGDARAAGRDDRFPQVDPMR